MKDFTDVLIDAIIENEIPRLDKIMNYVTKCISLDFTDKMYELIDKYYESYEPIRYVRVYGKRGRYAKNRMPRPGQVSLHAAITRQTGISGEGWTSGGGTLAFSGGSFIDGYVGGIRFDESKFQGNGMRHIGKGISEWNIVENFLFAGTGVNSDMESLVGDWRSHIAYDEPSADFEMMMYMSAYDPMVRQHYNDALKMFP